MDDTGIAMIRQLLKLVGGTWEFVALFYVLLHLKFYVVKSFFLKKYFS